MNYNLAQFFKSKLSDAIYTDRIAGLVRDVTKSFPTPDGRDVKKTFPVACDIAEDCTKDSVLRHLVPGGNPKDNLRTIIYFEDHGIVFEKKDAHYLSFVSSLQLTCWINLKRFKSGTCSLSGVIAADIINRLSIGINNYSPLTKIHVLKISELSKGTNIFSKYSYDDKNSYLIYPYDYFGLMIETKFSISAACANEIILDENDCIT